MAVIIKNGIVYGQNSNNTISIDKIYPIGSIYLSIESTSPATLFGGTWQQIKDVFLLGESSSHTNGSTGGVASVTLTAAQSGFQSSTTAAAGSCTSSSSGAHTHGMPSHTHSTSGGGHTHNFYGFHGSAYSSGGYPVLNYEGLLTGDPQSGGLGNTSYHAHNSDTSGGGTTGSSGAHTHAGISHSHTFSANNATSSHNNMPPYLAVYCWKRTA